jgi:hypothetical protein
VRIKCGFNLCLRLPRVLIAGRKTLSAELADCAKRITHPYELESAFSHCGWYVYFYNAPVVLCNPRWAVPFPEHFGFARRQKRGTPGLPSASSFCVYVSVVLLLGGFLWRQAVVPFQSQAVATDAPIARLSGPDCVAAFIADEAPVLVSSQLCEISTCRTVGTPQNQDGIRHGDSPPFSPHGQKSTPPCPQHANNHGSSGVKSSSISHITGSEKFDVSLLRIGFIGYAGKRVLLLDFSNCSAAEVEKMARAVPEAVTAQPSGSVLILCDFAGASFDHDAIRAMKETAVFNKPYIKKSAWIGAESFPEEFRQTLMSFSRREFPIFKSRQEALEWLVAD